MKETLGVTTDPQEPHKIPRPPLPPDVSPELGRMKKWY